MQLQFIGYVQAGLTQRVPNESVSQVAEVGGMSSLLPDDLLVEILSERLQVTTTTKATIIPPTKCFDCII